MDDPTNIRFIDAHSKSDRRTHDAGFVTNEELLIEFPLLGGESSMIGKRGKPTVAETLCHTIHGRACRAIDNTAIHGSPSNEVDNLFQRLIFWKNSIREIWAIETRNEDLRIF